MKRHSLIALALTLALPVVVACSSVQAGSSAGVNTTTGQQSTIATADELTTEQQTTTTAAGSATAAGEGATTPDEQDAARPEGWSDASHSSNAELNTEVVFPQAEVNQITITISPENWAAMQANMAELYGEAGSGRALPGMDGPPAMDGAAGQPPAMPEDGAPPARPNGPGGRPGGMPMGGDLIDENPEWGTATVTFQYQTWNNVGIRYKGNSSLSSAWNSGSLKLPFKLDFDKFEDDYPEIKNQRFYGFDKLSFSNNFADGTAMRDTVMYDVLDAAGLPASETAYYQVYFDYGDGPVLTGLYTVIEETDDTVIEGYFGRDDGNIYKPEGEAASLAEGTFDSIADSFEKEDNEDAADWSDIEALYGVLHSEQRTSDPTAWRASLETIFDVDTFLETMAINAIAENWDTYGQMLHNYYLYNNPASGQLTWISWDHNMVLGSGGGPGGRGGLPGGPQGGPDGQNSSTLDRANVTDDWPLIRNLLDDPTYSARYIDYLRQTSETAFVANELEVKIEQLAGLIGPYVTQESNQQDFDAAVQQLIERIYDRAAVTADFLVTQ
jgi:spore coat protein CotH